MPPRDLQHIAAHTLIHNWLREEQWVYGFDEKTLGRALGVRASLEHVDLVEESAGDQPGISLFGKAPQGFGVVDVRVDIMIMESERKGDGYFVDAASACDCPRRANCMHAAALLHVASRAAVKLPKAAPRPARDSASSAPESPGLSDAAVGWLRQVRGAFAETDAPPRREPASREFQKFLAYCIEPVFYDLQGGHFMRANLVFHVGTHNSKGEKVVQKAYAITDLTKPPRYMSDEDILICARFHRRPETRGLHNTADALTGGDWDDILEPAMRAGRLFLGLSEAGIRGERLYIELTEGPPVFVAPGWKTTHDGLLKPVLELPDREGLRLLTTRPIRYIDAVSGHLGFIESDLPDEALASWIDAPALQQHELAEIGDTLAALPTPSPLPLPVPEPLVEHHGRDPRPVLRLTQHHVGVFLRRVYAFDLSFLYEQCPDLVPHGSAETRAAWRDEAGRHLLARDAAAEQSLAARLADTGLVPIATLFPPYELDPGNRHAFCLPNLAATQTEVLQALESNALRALEADGWILEKDAAIGINIRNILDLFPTLEGGPEIDWFRFDLLGDCDGKRISLLPHLARAIEEDWQLAFEDPATRPEFLILPCVEPEDGHIRFPAARFFEILEHTRHLLLHPPGPGGGLVVHRIGAAQLAAALAARQTELEGDLANLGRSLQSLAELPSAAPPPDLQATLRPYQEEGFRWLQFLARHRLHGILADDMGLGKTLQTLAHLAAENAAHPGRPSLVVAPTSVVPNWAAEAARFTPHLKVLMLQGAERLRHFDQIPHADIVITSYPLLVRDFERLTARKWQVVVLDEAQYIKNAKSLAAEKACQLDAEQRLCLSGTPLENHLGELWSLMRFLMPGYLGDLTSFNSRVRRPIEAMPGGPTQKALNRRVAPLILRRTKDQVATELPEKTILVHGIDLSDEQSNLYESVRATMDSMVRSAIAEKGFNASQILVLSALLKLRQLCCHPALLDAPEAAQSCPSAKFDHLTEELLPQLLEEGRRILLFSQFTSMLARIEDHLIAEDVPYLKLTGETKDRASLVKRFQTGEIPVFLISLKAGGTGLNLTAADTVILYDPWWNPAAENQATDRAHRIGQTKPVFVHKLVCRGTIEDRILQLQEKKAAYIRDLLTEETSRAAFDAETLSHLLAPL